MKDLEQEILLLKKRIEQLEKKNNVSLFGRSYSLLGTPESDLILKTRGLVKIQWGNKFIDLIKNGRFNVDSKFLYEVQNILDISLDGIYLTNGQVYMKIGDNPLILLSLDNNTSYVSFMEQSDITPDLKHTALINIGFLYPSRDHFNETSLQNGIIYIEEEKKLYIVSNGVLSEYTVETSNIFNKAITIQKTDNLYGAVIIKGQGISNSLAFNELLYIYSENTENIIDSKLDLVIKSGNVPVIRVSSNGSTIPNLFSNNIQSEKYSSNSGYSISETDGIYTLTIDKVVLRFESQNDLKIIVPEYYLYNTNVISNISDIQILEEEKGFIFTSALYLPNTYLVDDELIFYCYKTKKLEEPENPVERTFEKIFVKVLSVEGNNVTVLGEVSLSYSDLSSLPNTLVMLIKRDSKFPLRIKDNTIDIYSEDKSLARLGDLSELSDQNPINTLLNGIYSLLGLFENICYVNGYELSDDDNSSRLASTEWVNNKINSVPSGCILLCEESNVPDGWKLCDGNDGTPDLTGLNIEANGINLVYIIKI